MTDTQPDAPSDAAAPAVIDIEGLSMVYRGRSQETVALKDANLTVRAGEFISLIGPSGCGKTTLLRLVADLIQPSSGHMQVAGKTPREARLERAYGYMFQAPVLYRLADRHKQRDAAARDHGDRAAAAP